jgi:hypothetical protein
MFDPNIPADHADLTGVMFRGQFQGLKALIDAVSGVTSAVVDSVTTLPSGSPAVVSVSVSGGTLHLSFELPRGNDGAQGAQGTPGNNGNDGAPGAQGPPFANAIVDAVNTLNPGEPANVGVNFDGTNVRFTFGIPRGSDGAMGLPGEVSQVDLNNGLLNTLNQTSANTNAVSTLSQPADSNYNQTQMQDMLNKMNELITALRR